MPKNIDNIIDEYIKANNKEGEYSGDMELYILSNMLNINIVVLIIGYIGYNIFNIYKDVKNNNLNENIIFLCKFIIIQKSNTSLYK